MSNVPCKLNSLTANVLQAIFSGSNAISRITKDVILEKARQNVKYVLNKRRGEGLQGTMLQRERFSIVSRQPDLQNCF